MINKEKIYHLAKLARLKLTEDELQRLTQDLNKILDFVEKINELNLENFSPLTNILEKLPFRKDEIKESDNQEIIKNFPEKEKNYLKVPKILEK